MIAGNPGRLLALRRVTASLSASLDTATRACLCVIRHKVSTCSMFQTLFLAYRCASFGRVVCRTARRDMDQSRHRQTSDSDQQRRA